MKASDPHPDPTEADADSGAGPGRASAAGAPRWLTVFGIVVGVLVVMVFILMHLTGAVGPSAH